MKRRWQDLSPGTRRVIVVAGLVDTGLRAVALVDLARRSEDEINGSRRRWAFSLAFVNSVGLLPLAYLRWGRRH